MIVLKPDKTYIYILTTEFEHTIRVTKYNSLRQAQEIMINEFIDTCGGTCEWIDDWTITYEEAIQTIIDHNASIDDTDSEFMDIMDKNNYDVGFYCSKDYAYIRNCEGETYVLTITKIEV